MSAANADNGGMACTTPPERIVAQVVELYNMPIGGPVRACDDGLDLQMIMISHRTLAR